MSIQRCCMSVRGIAKLMRTWRDRPTQRAAPQYRGRTASRRGAKLLAEFVQFSQLRDQAINALLQWNRITGV
jgi:hypothetical protein